MSQQSNQPAPARRRRSSVHQIEEGTSPSPQPANSPGEVVRSDSSDQGTVVGSPEGKFDFGDRLKAALNRMDDEDIKKRELGVGFAVRLLMVAGSVAHLLDRV